MTEQTDQNSAGSATDKQVVDDLALAGEALLRKHPALASIVIVVDWNFSDQVKATLPLGVFRTPGGHMTIEHLTNANRQCAAFMHYLASCVVSMCVRAVTEASSKIKALAPPAQPADATTTAGHP